MGPYPSQSETRTVPVVIVRQPSFPGTMVAVPLWVDGSRIIDLKSSQWCQVWFTAGAHSIGFADQSSLTLDTASGPAWVVVGGGQASVRKVDKATAYKWMMDEVIR